MKQLDIYGDYSIEEDYESEVEVTDHHDLLDRRPDDSLVWFANFGVEVVGLSGESSQYISPDSVLFELVKALHESKDETVDQMLTKLNLATYSVKAENPDIDGD